MRINISRLEGNNMANPDPTTLGSTTTTGVNAQLPQYIAPYLSNLLPAAETVASQQYLDFGQHVGADGQVTGNAQSRVQNLNDAQTNANTGIAGLTQPGQFGQAGTAYGQAQNMTQNAAGQNWTDPGTAANYMNPYQQNVIDITNQQARRQSDIQGTQDSAQFAKSGAFGGSRQGVVDAERERNLGILQSNNQAQGMNTAYNNAQGQFNADRTNQMTGGAQLGNLGTGMANLGTATQTADLTRLGAQNQAGTQQYNLDQSNLTNQYNDFLAKQNYGKQQLSWLGGIYNGTPQANATTTTQTSTPAAPNQTMQNLAIAGGLASLYNTVSGSK
jgi:hypothetical protein